MMRQQPFFQSHEIDLRKLETLGAVQRHQGDGISGELRVFRIGVVAVGDGNLVEELGKLRFLGSLLITAQRIHHLFHRRPAGLLVVGIFSIQPS